MFIRNKEWEYKQTSDGLERDKKKRVKEGGRELMIMLIARLNENLPFEV